VTGPEPNAQLNVQLNAQPDAQPDAQPNSGLNSEPELRLRAIPLHEPQAASSVAPATLAPVAAARSARAALCATQGTLALTLPWENAPLPALTGPAAPSGFTSAGAATLREVSDQPSYGVVTGPGRWSGVALPSARPVVGVLPDPKEWAAKFVQAAIEVALGLRPASQLIRWTSIEVHESLVRRGELVARAVRRGGIQGVQSVQPQLRALITCSPAPQIWEVAAVIAEASRVRAVAFRMEGIQGRWRVTVLDIG
jgi:Family of unknown function (DUF6459)